MSSKKLTCGVYLSAPSPPRFSFGVASNFVGSEYGKIQSVKLLQQMVSNRTGLNNPQPLPATHCLYLLCFEAGKGGRGRVEPERRLEGQQFTKLGRKYQHD